MLALQATYHAEVHDSVLMSRPHHSIETEQKQQPLKNGCGSKVVSYLWQPTSCSDLPAVLIYQLFWARP